MLRYLSDHQYAIYRAAMPPALPMSYEDWEARAREALPEASFGYVAGGAGGFDTMRANRDAFYRWRLRPRMLRDVTGRDVSTTVFGAHCLASFLLAPVGVLEIMRPEAEVGVAHAAAATRTPMVLSTVASRSIEEVAEASGANTRWFQLYPGRDRDVIASFIGRAERAGYSALVVTLDTQLLGWREWDLRNAYLPFNEGKGMANFLSDPVFRSRLPVPPEKDIRPAVARFSETVSNPAMTWADLRFIRELTSLPLLLKGILRSDDALQALDYGVDGLVVSNHGGRQVDGAVAALDALAEVVEAVAGRAPVLMDSGIRRGADVLKALALGAAAVLVGRPYVWGLAVAGSEGVAQVIRNLMADVDLAFGLTGCTSIRDVDRSLVVRTD